MRPAVRLGLVIGAQLLVLASLLGLKAYTAATTTTIVLETRETRPLDLAETRQRIPYAIGDINRDGGLWDDDAWGTVYVELAKNVLRGTWEVVRVHDGREHSAGGTVIIRGDTDYIEGATRAGEVIHLDIERVRIATRDAGRLPDGNAHVIDVEVKVDRFGNATPLRFIIDGEPYALERW